MFRERKPDLIMHCAALTNLWSCEQDPRAASAINVEATCHLAHLARHIPFILVSTDLVFDGQHPPYDESATPAPLTVYARTKREAERRVLENPHHAVIRTSLLAGVTPSGQRSFSEQTYREWQEGRTVRLFTDEFRCPLPALILARAMWELAEQRISGLYHVAGRNRLSRYEIGLILARRKPHLKCRIEPARITDFPGPPRSPDTTLVCNKVKPLLSFDLPDFEEWLDAHPEEPI